MERLQWNKLTRIVRAVNETLATGRHSTSDDWRELADDLKIAQQLAEAEAEQLERAEFDEGR